MINKKHTQPLIIILALLVVAACAIAIAIGTGKDTSNIIPKKIPKKTPMLDINLVTMTTNDDSQTQISQNIQAAQLTNTWYVVKKNGVGSGYSSDSFHPLQRRSGYDDVTLSLNNGGTITLLFSDKYMPQSVSVHRWNAEYAGKDLVDPWGKAESINVVSNTFQVSDDGNDYIYEVNANWQEGKSSYVFRIDSNLPLW